MANISKIKVPGDDTIYNVKDNISGYTTNTGTITGITMNGSSKGTSGVVNLGTVLTVHQTIKQDGVTGATVNRFGTCSTAAATAAKTVSITTGTFALEAGSTIAVKFSNANTANNPTLAVNSTAAKNIFVNGAQITTGGNKALLTGTVVFVYDGTQWNLIGNYYDTNTQTVTGVKGNSESSYRTGNVNITAANIGLGNVENKSSATIRGELTSSNVTTALGYTPYDSANPNGYTSNTGTVTKVKVGQATYNPSDGVVSLPAYPGALPASDVVNTYNSSSTVPISGKGVAAALGTLDGTISGSAGASKTLTAFSETDGKVSATFGNISITKSQVSDFPSLGTASGKNYTTSVTSGSADLVTSGAVYTAIDALPEPMVFKGSLGTGGTITALPVNGSATIGDTYKVITAGTYASKSAKVGDTFICLTKTSSANTWELIPSGDEPSGTVTSVKLANATNGGLTISGTNPVTTSGTINVGHTNIITAGTAKGDDSKTLTFGGTFTIPSVTYDVNGHITAKGTTTMTMPANPNSDTKVTVSSSDPTSQTTYYPTVATGAGTGGLNYVPNISYLTRKGSTSVNGYSYLVLGNSTDAGADGNKFGGVVLYSKTGSHYAALTASDDMSGASDNVYLKLPTTSGTLALTSDIPTVNNATLTIQKNGATVKTFTANASSNVTCNITVPTSAADVSALPSTTKYAASASVGGAATSANKLNTDAGSSTNPVYFSGGVPVACTYSLNATVPSNAVFTDAKVTASAASPSSETTYYPTLATATSGTGGVKTLADTYITTKKSTSSATGYSVLTLGSHDSSGAVKNKFGGINLRPQTGSGKTLVLSSSTVNSDLTVRLPSASGTLMLNPGEVGSTSRPVYFNSSGTPVAGGTISVVNVIYPQDTWNITSCKRGFIIAGRAGSYVTPVCAIVDEYGGISYVSQNDNLLTITTTVESGTTSKITLKNKLASTVTNGGVTIVFIGHATE